MGYLDKMLVIYFNIVQPLVCKQANRLFQERNLWQSLVTVSHAILGKA